jgi:hypothetical protein
MLLAVGAQRIGGPRIPMDIEDLQRILEAEIGLLDLGRQVLE